MLFVLELANRRKNITRSAKFSRKSFKLLMCGRAEELSCSRVVKRVRSNLKIELVAFGLAQ